MSVRLSRCLILEAPRKVSDGAGGYTETWVELGKLWAEVQGRTGRERDGLGLPLARVSYRITVRAAPVGAPSRPLPEQRFREGDRVFPIEAVAEADPGALYLTCFAREEELA